MDLQGTFSTALLAEAFAKHGAFPFAPQHWKRSGPRLDSHAADARGHLGRPWPTLILNDYLRYYRDGNRSEYEKTYFNRRRRLGSAALALAAGGDHAFAAEAADGIWLVCEESSWCLPAHARHGLAADIPSRLPPTGMVERETGKIS